jgi:hypothetical protein
MAKTTYSRDNIDTLIDRILDIIGQKTNSIKVAEMTLDDMKTLIQAVTALTSVRKDYKLEIDLLTEAVKSKPTTELRELARVIELEGRVLSK